MDRDDAKGNTQNGNGDQAFENFEGKLTGMAGKVDGSRNVSTVQRIVAAIGNVLEWFCFSIFGYFADIIAVLFFPVDQAGKNALVESFAVYGGAFLMRPIGGLILGYIGDTYGRKRAMEVSFFCMALATFAIGCLPTYQRIGWLSTILLVGLRLVQGVSVGGQIMSSIVFAVENNPREKWGLVGSFVMAESEVGTLLACVVAHCVRITYSLEQLLSWSWRLPFLFGLVLGIPGLYIKWFIDDVQYTQQVARIDVTERVNPIRAAFSAENRRSLLSCSLVPMIWCGGYYFTFVWGAIFMQDMVDPPVTGAFVVNSSSLFLGICIMLPVAGILSDKYGIMKIMTISGTCMIIFSPAMVFVIAKGDWLAAFFAQYLMGVLISLWGAPMLTWMVESFPAEARLTAVSVGYNLAQAIVGSSTASIATIIVDRIGVNWPGFFVSALALISMIGLYIAPSNDSIGYQSTTTDLADANVREVTPLMYHSRIKDAPLTKV